MKLTQNVGEIDRSIRVLAGAALMGFSVYAGIWWLAIVGGIIFLTGVLGRCGLYYLLGVNTCPTKK